MKSLIFTIVTFAAALSFAEVKPEGALVPLMCGPNVFEGFTVTSPETVCMGEAEGMPGMGYVSLDYGNTRDTEFYFVRNVGEADAGDVVQVDVSRAVVEKRGGYTFIVGTEEKQSSFRFSPMTSTLFGPFFKAPLVPVATTTSF